MSDPHTEQGQIERARRLREHIERLKSGQPEPGSSPASLKEQIEQRERDLEKERTDKHE